MSLVKVSHTDSNPEHRMADLAVGVPIIMNGLLY